MNLQLFLDRLTIPQKMILSFVSVIIVGSILLSLPISHKTDAIGLPYLAHLFTAVSMACVTGLTVLSVHDIYNPFGQFICMILMQVGGLGLVTLIAMSLVFLRQKFSVVDNQLLKTALNRNSSVNMASYLKNVYVFTFVVEFIAALLLMIDFVPRYGVKHGIFNAFFIAISAFCNAGFDNLGTTSLQQFVTNPLVNLTIMGLIIGGSSGFGVWAELITKLRRALTDKPRSFRLAFKHLTPNTRLVIYTSAWILLLATISTWLIEANNPKTLAQYNFFEQGLISLFQSVAFRTAGFATIDYTMTEPATNVIYMLQMLIGGAPGGTAGGIKVTSAAIMWLVVLAEIKGHSEISFAKRVIPAKIIKVTLTIMLYYMLILFFGYIGLLLSQQHLDPFALLFESVSALATVGSSMNVTGQLNSIGQMLIILMMFFGRLGPITVVVGIMQKRRHEIHYAETDILIG